MVLTTGNEREEQKYKDDSFHGFLLPLCDNLIKDLSTYATGNVGATEGDPCTALTSIESFTAA